MRALARAAADEPGQADNIEKLTRWCIRALTTPDGQQAVHGWVSFRMPAGVDFANLVPIKVITKDGAERFENASGHSHARDGFHLTDPRMHAREVQSEINYCVYCHDHDGDFCSKGFPEKKGEPDKGIKKNAIGVTLDGCPLEEKISEMHSLKRDGHTISALAMIMVDNPMCPATGHRICNDCMKACIYQKQDPVNIPQIETRCLTDVLALPWGVEIYDLLTRWNPLRPQQWLPKPYNGLKVLITGMGPAGFTLAHHLLQEGFAVVGVDGLKIEPLPDALVNGPVHDYKRTRRRPRHPRHDRLRRRGRIRHHRALGQEFPQAYLPDPGAPAALPGLRLRALRRHRDARRRLGTGLRSCRRSPSAPACRRRCRFPDRWRAACARPRISSWPCSSPAPPRNASLANLQVRLPAVVIGGGLTGIDTATEVQAYYIKQVEKTLDRYETLVAAHGSRSCASRAGRRIARRYSMNSSRTASWCAPSASARRKEKRPPDFTALIQQWGGVTVAYRRTLQRVAGLSAQSRGSDQGDGGRHLLRRLHEPGGRGSTTTATCRRWCANA